MKRFYMMAIAMTIAVCASAQDDMEPVAALLYSGGVDNLPQTVTYHNQNIIYTGISERGYYNAQTLYTIYDGDFNLIKTLTITRPSCKGGSIRKYRAEVQHYDDEGHCLFRDYTGDWNEANNTYDAYLTFTEPGYMDFDQHFSDEKCDLPFSQTLFNHNDEFEYFIYRCTSVPSIEENDRDGNGEIDEIITKYTPTATGLDVYSEEGNLLMSLPPIRRIVKSNNRFYGLSGEHLTEDRLYEASVYLIDPATTSVKKLENVQLKIQPNVVDRGGMVTVELDDTDTARELVVTGMDGRIVERRDIPAGERTIQVPAARMASGMYNFTIRKRGTVEKNGKVIVK